MTARKIPILATLVVAAAIATMIWLGFWQLDRMEQKEAMVAEFARNSSNSAIGSPTFDNEDQFLYRTVRIDCEEPQAWTAIAGRNARDQTGYVHQYTCRTAQPFGGLDEGVYQPALFAVIGWSPGPDQVEFAGGPIEGVLVRAGNDFRVVSNTPLAGLEANKAPDPASTPNNHFAYAIQWFLFAAVALVIYILALRRRAR